MAERPWYYLTPEQAQQGPLTQTELTQQLAAGLLAPDTLVWSEPMAQWQPAASLPELAVREAPSGTMTLSPSDLVVLHAPQFAAKAGFLGTKFEPLFGAGEAGADPLSQALFYTVLTAMERMGAVRLTVRAKKALFGLRTVNTVWVEPTGAYVAWPEPSLEATLTGMLAGGPQEVEALIYTLMGSDSSNPWWDAVMMAVGNLKARGLVYEEEVKGFLSKSTKHRATPQAVQLATTQDITWIQQLISAPNPEYGQLLAAAIKKALKRRVESDDDGPDFDNDGPDID